MFMLLTRACVPVRMLAFMLHAHDSVNIVDRGFYIYLRLCLWFVYGIHVVYVCSCCLCVLVFMLSACDHLVAYVWLCPCCLSALVFMLCMCACVHVAFVCLCSFCCCLCAYVQVPYVCLCSCCMYVGLCSCCMRMRMIR